MVSGDLDYDFSEIFTETLSQWIATSFRNHFRLSLQPLGDELEGGVSPPPHQAVGNLDANQGAACKVNDIYDAYNAINETPQAWTFQE